MFGYIMYIYRFFFAIAICMVWVFFFVDSSSFSNGLNSKYMSMSACSFFFYLSSYSSWIHSLGMKWFSAIDFLYVIDNVLFMPLAAYWTFFFFWQDRDAIDFVYLEHDNRRKCQVWPKQKHINNVQYLLGYFFFFLEKPKWRKKTLKISIIWFLLLFGIPFFRLFL